MTKHEHYQAIIIGAGPAGIGAAVELSRRGVGPLLIIEREPQVGGIPAKYHAKRGGVPTFITWQSGRIVQGGNYANWLREQLAATTAEVLCQTQVLSVDRPNCSLELVNPEQGCFTVSADAVLMACGSRDKTVVEKGWVAGDRSARILPTMQLLELLGEGKRLPLRRPVMLGSDLIAWAASVKLLKQGAESVHVADHAARPQTSLPARLFFGLWGRPSWRSLKKNALLQGKSLTKEIVLDGESTACDGVLVSGELVPNSELLVDAGFQVQPLERKPEVSPSGELSEPRWFAAGNLIGGFHAAHWCYRHGRRVARKMAQFLQDSPLSTGTKKPLPAIAVDHLTVSYGPTPALLDVSFSVPSGQLVGIIGPNGSGKSTLIKSILGFIEADVGAVRIFGEPAQRSRGRVAYVPQRGAIDWDFPITVGEAVLMGRYGHVPWWKNMSRQDMEVAEEALDTVGMSEFADRQIGQLSGGQQQRVFMARALAQGAEILLLDEPFAGVDAVTEKAILEVLKQTKRQGRTLLVVHHDLATASEYFDTVVLLKRRLYAYGPPSAVLDPELLAEVYEGKLRIFGDMAAKESSS